MKDNELRKLDKKDLIEIIYQLKVSEEKLRSELEECKKQLADAGSLTAVIERLNRSIDKIDFVICREDSAAEEERNDG